MESMPAQATQQKASSKKIIFLAIGALFALIGVIYFWLKSKKNTSTPVDNTATSNTKTDNNTDTSKSNSGGSGSGGGSTTTLTPVISITEASLSPSPLIGQSHLKAKITIQNPPATGTLQILFDNGSIDSVSLPLQDNIYLVDTYVATDGDVEIAHTLTAKVGSVTKSITLYV